MQVVYGVVGYKTHAKMLLIVRREKGALRRYVHLSTGNYHQVTSRIYTDFGLMTADPDIGEDVHKLFQQLSGLGPVIELKRLLQSPFTLHKGVMAKIEREIAHARAGKPARIIAKMNALNEAERRSRLCTAPRSAGVQIDLIVRGACTLRPGVPGISENIRVRSIVGRFLEHSRVYWFANGGDAGDLLLQRRLDGAQPAAPHRDVLPDPRRRSSPQRVYDEALANYLADNTQAWLLDADGHYERATPGDEPPHSAQQALLTKFANDRTRCAASSQRGCTAAAVRQNRAHAQRADVPGRQREPTPTSHPRRRTARRRRPGLQQLPSWSSRAMSTASRA